MRTQLLGIVITSTWLTAAATFGQDADVFGRLDKNSDGEVTADEVGEDAKGLFERMLRNSDKNKDGKLSKEEFAAGLTARRERPAGERPAGERPPGGPAVDPGAMFDRLDRNADGKLTKEELPERLANRFERLDANSDGTVEKDEFRRRLAAFAPGTPGVGPSPEMAAGLMVIRALDSDDDGALSASEIADAPKVLAKFDKNGDGKLDESELVAPERRAARPGAEAFAARLKEADKNGDGKLSKEEAPERLQQVFDRIDANSDGQIDADEMRTFFARRPQ